MRRPFKLIKSLIKEIEDLTIEGADELGLPELTVNYEAWYTNALRMVQNLIRERLEDFVSAYKNNRNAPISYSSYTIQDYLLGIKADRSSKADYNSNVLFRRLILRQVGILSSVLKTRPVSEGSSEVISQAEFYTQALDQARKLFENGRVIPAGVLAATVLENYLKWLWRRRNIRLDEKGFCTEEINDYLFKFQTYNKPTWARIKGLIPIVEACLDPQKKPPSKKEIGIMIADVKKVVGAGL